MDLRDILKPGVTGCVSRAPRMSEDTLAAWRAECQRAARHLQAKRLEEVPVQVARNFSSQSLELIKSKQRVHFLLHAVLPYVAVADRLEWNANAYGNESVLRGFFGPPFVVVPRALLEQSFSLEPWMTELIDKAAVSDIKYWKPRRVGDFLFNYYD
jgi:hypothetical protein